VRERSSAKANASLHAIVSRVASRKIDPMVVLHIAAAAPLLPPLETSASRLILSRPGGDGLEVVWALPAEQQLFFEAF
jgi:hypothetical protein